MRVSSLTVVTVLGFVVGLAACGSDDSPPGGGGGGGGAYGGTGGAGGIGGDATGGVGGIGGDIGTGGEAGTGGTGGTGGNAGIGGDAGSGGIGDSGGTGGTGDDAGSGGTGDSGGTGGDAGSGGTSDSGGTGGTGGDAGSGGTGGTGGTGDDAGTAGMGGDAATDSAGGTGGTDGDAETNDTGEAGGSGACTEVHIDNTRGQFGSYVADIVPSIFGADPDLLVLDLHDDVPEIYDLAAGDNANYATCEQCLRVFVDDTGTASEKLFWQQSGTLRINSTDEDLRNDLIDANLEGVTLVEVVESGDDLLVVPGGECLTIGNERLLIEQLDGWTCRRSFFEDGEICDCDCGVWDPDCDNVSEVRGCDADQTCEKDGNGDPVCEDGSGPKRYSHTITIDGENDFCRSETFSTTTEGYSAMVAWDETHLYVGMQGYYVGQGVRSNKLLVIYFGGIDGTRDGFEYNTQKPSLPFDAQWHMHWKADNSHMEARQWNGSSWEDDHWDFAGTTYQEGDFVEIAIPLANIGLPSTLALCMAMINEEAWQETTFAGVPSDSFEDKVNPDFTTYYRFDLTSSKTPWDQTNLP